MIKLLTALFFLGLNFYIYDFLATDEIVPARETFRSFPLELGDWSCSEREEMDSKTLKWLGATDYLSCTYVDRKTNEWVQVYVGYHASQVRKEGGGGNAHAIHPPEHCLPGSGWDIIDAEVAPLDFAGLPERSGLLDDGPTAKRFEIAKGESRQLVYFWYQGRGRVVSANPDVVLLRFLDRATRGRTDGALVRFTTPLLHGDADAAEARYRALASLVVPVLPRFVPE